MQNELLKELKRIGDSLEKIENHLSKISINTTDPWEEYVNSEEFKQVQHAILDRNKKSGIFF